MKQRRLVVADTEESMGRFLLAYRTLLTEVYLFKYFGRNFLSSDNDWPEMEQNLWPARGKWGQWVKVFGEGGIV